MFLVVTAISLLIPSNIRISKAINLAPPGDSVMIWIKDQGLWSRWHPAFLNLPDAISSAARLARLSEYGLKEYPESQSWINAFLNRKKTEPAAMIRSQLGEDNYRVYRQLIKIREMTESVQARLPFEWIVN